MSARVTGTARTSDTDRPLRAEGLDVAIVSYRSRDLLANCLETLFLNKPKVSMNVWVVDNHSLDGTVDLVRDRFPQVRLLPLETNTGFSRATNLALNEGIAPYVLVLNPDTRMRPGTLDYLIELMRDRPEIGIAGCRLELEDGSFDHAAKRAFPTALGALGHFTGVGRRASGGRLAQYRAPEVESGPVDAVNGAFMLIRRRMLDQIGLFDEGYWLYMEDLDLCYRAKQAHWLTWYEPSVSAVHVKHGTTGGSRSLRLVYHFHRGMYRFFRKHYASERSAAFNATIYAGLAAKLVLALLAAVVRRR